MKELECKFVSVSKSGDEYFQVCFEKNYDSISDYLLLQRVFEDEEFEEQSYYIEFDDERYIGSNILKEDVLSRNNFKIVINDSQELELKVIFDLPDKRFKELKKSLEIILSGFNVLKTDFK